MATLYRRYSVDEFRRLRELIYPEERRHEFTNRPWSGEGFRHYRDSKIVCIEHYWPRDQVPKSRLSKTTKPAA